MDNNINNIEEGELRKYFKVAGAPLLVVLIVVVAFYTGTQYGKITAGIAQLEPSEDQAEQVDSRTSSSVESLGDIQNGVMVDGSNHVLAIANTESSPCPILLSISGADTEDIRTTRVCSVTVDGEALNFEEDFGDVSFGNIRAAGAELSFSSEISFPTSEVIPLECKIRDFKNPVAVCVKHSAVVGEGAQKVFSESDLLGDWVQPLPESDCSNTSSGENCFEGDSASMRFEIIDGKKVFNSYLHHRPEMTSCSWDLTDNKVTIGCLTTGDEFRIIGLTPDTLLITHDERTDGTFQSSETYTRLK